MANEIVELLSALRNGEMSLDQVALQFRERSWSRRDLRRPNNYSELMAADAQDPEPYIPGSFDDVTAAYHRGELTDEQYDVLAAAMTESLTTEDAIGPD